MGDYEASTDICVAQAELFGYLRDVDNLPTFLPRLTSVTPTGGDRYTVTAHIDPEGGPERDVAGEAWIEVREAGRTLAWGADGPNDYSGELDVDPGGQDGTSRLTVRLHTERVEGPGLQDGMAQTLAGIKRAAESRH